VEGFISRLGLHIKDNWQVFRVADRGVDVLGYRFFHTHTLIRKSTAYRLHRRIKRIGKHIPTPSEVSAVFSYMGITSHCDSRNFIIKYILPYVDLGALKELQSENSKSLAIA
jgi:RNA-directed DNA polymerase